jgi:hypothetical protein
LCYNNSKKKEKEGGLVVGEAWISIVIKFWACIGPICQVRWT